MSTTRLEVITPERVLITRDVHMVFVRTDGGELGILPRHAPLAATVKAGVVKVRLEDGSEDFISVGGGFLEVRPERVTLLADTAELGGSVDVERAQEAKNRAEKRLSQGQDVDLRRAELALSKALSRLQAWELSQKAGSPLKDTVQH
ncbi:ATP synthase F1 subunit epsilon [Alicyclobacillaceae bacterium I2511]|nr:ATP synthase F1 subunit epsilon [Alicyclobacillaceae bacterium I2511]